ncbi:MAG: Smr/MutS family protein [Vicinamibacterales bacterium]
MTYAAGDAVHVAGLGKGVVRERLNKGRFRVEVKGRVLIATGAQLTAVAAPHPPRAVQRVSDSAEPPAPVTAETAHGLRSVDLHGRTVVEAIPEVQAFLNEALLAGDAAVRIIHGRSGGRIKAAVHAQLKVMAVHSFRLDPRNPGVTIVTL